MGRIPPTVWIWLTATAAMALMLIGVNWFRNDDGTAPWIAAGVTVSLVTMLSTSATVYLAGATGKPLHRLLIETSVRLAVPLGILLAIAITHRDLLTTEFLLYFLPFQFITIVADTFGSVWWVQTEMNRRSSSDA